MHARREEMEQPYLRLRQIVLVARALDDPRTDVGASESIITFTGPTMVALASSRGRDDRRCHQGPLRTDPLPDRGWPTRIQCHFEGETVWLTQAQMAEPFQTTPQNITLHLKDTFAEGELYEEATCKSYLQVRQEGGRTRHAEPLFLTNATPEGARSIKGVFFSSNNRDL